jgi:hypothetical protein
MELKVVFWIIIGLIYFFTKLKKKNPAASRPEEESYHPSQGGNTETTKPPITFEELLREIQGTKTEQQQPKPVFYDTPQTVLTSPKEVDYEDYDDDLGKEDKDLEDGGYDYKKEDTIYKTYEDAKSQAFERPSLEESLKLEDTVVKYGQFKGYQQVSHTSFLADYIKELKDPKGFKKAFIMSEIIQRRF